MFFEVTLKILCVSLTSCVSSCANATNGRCLYLIRSLSLLCVLPFLFFLPWWERYDRVHPRRRSCGEDPWFVERARGETRWWEGPGGLKRLGSVHRSTWSRPWNSGPTNFHPLAPTCSASCTGRNYTTFRFCMFGTYTRRIPVLLFLDAYSEHSVHMFCKGRVQIIKMEI